MPPTEHPPLVPTPARWLAAVMDDFDAFLVDHASCEKKASGMALNVAAHYPDRPELLGAMADLAVEELSHYREVVRLLLQRGVVPRADQRDPYVRQLNGLIRQGPATYLLDRLLVAAIIERRGHERFALLAEHLGDGMEARFYRAIAASEERHWLLFASLAHHACHDADEIADRLAELTAAEGELMLGLPFRPALH
jgi:tRNA-(ms[2]io[6]A)-hydroxylase